MAWMVLKWSTFKIISSDPDLHPRWPPSADHWTVWEFHWKTFLWETTQQIEYFALYECYLDGSTPDLLFWCWSV